MTYGLAWGPCARIAELPSRAGVAMPSVASQAFLMGMHVSQSAGVCSGPPFAVQAGKPRPEGSSLAQGHILGSGSHPYLVGFHQRAEERVPSLERCGPSPVLLGAWCGQEGLLWWQVQLCPWKMETGTGAGRGRVGGGQGLCAQAWRLACSGVEA